MRRRIILGVALAATAVLGTIPALAATSQPSVVSATPVSYTPNVMDGTVYAITVVGNTVVVGGDFTTVENSARTTTYKKSYLFTYNYTTGAVNTGFTAALDGPVLALTPGPDSTIYVGGEFKKVGSIHQRGITRLAVATGTRIKGFDAIIGDGEVRAVKYSAGGRLYIGGNFATVDGTSRPALALVGGTSGKVDTKFNLSLTSPTAGRTKIEDMSLSPDGKTLVAVGAIQHAQSLSRAQVVVVNTTTTTAKVANWYTNFYNVNCYGAFETYMRGVDFSPKGDYFVVVTTGRLTGNGRPCDTASRFNVAGTGLHNPVWSNYTGGNTLLSVAVTGTAVYVGGHQQWLDNPQGNKSAGPGAVSRPGIGAIDPTSGKALSWNPTASRGVGIEALFATSNGLLVGDDTTELGKQYHARLGMFPLK
ncbi:MAG TPA: PKD domain containing protein [Micromonosporaceae bacterium]|jgi:hypothetical protein